MSHCTCDYHQEQNKTDYSHAHLIPSHSNEGQLGEEKEYPICNIDDSGLCISPENHPASEEKKDWEEEFDNEFAENNGPNIEPSFRDPNGDVGPVKQFIREKLKEEREKWRLKNAGLYRQLFGEMPDKTFTSKELWKILDSYAPLFTEEQKKELSELIRKKMV